MQLGYDILLDYVASEIRSPIPGLLSECLKSHWLQLNGSPLSLVLSKHGYDNCDYNSSSHEEILCIH
ncbi:hypothetical protein QQP08_010317 [Theobroma cacao]|nr:hypothetical protein QQP08_010317 [Theobroma cacao]